MRRKLIVVAILALISVQLSFSAQACAIPVFRYALERWSADSYHLVIFREGPLTPQQAKVVASLRKAAEIGYYNSPLIISEFDIKAKAEIPEEFRSLAQSDAGLPRMHLLMPGSFGLNKEVWSGPLTPENGEFILQSPVRNETARRIVEGDSVVWIFLEGASASENAKALGVLRKTLKDAESELELPHELDEEDPVYDMATSDAVALKLKFSIISVKRSDPMERILVNTINHIVSDPKQSKKPVAVPVFGRGRALETHAGDAINEGNIFDACDFLVGPCSCQVKELNPGVDLFMPIDWDGLVEGTIGVDEALPPLSVPVPLIAGKQTVTNTDKQVQDSRLRRNLAAAAIIGLIVLAVGTFAVIRRKDYGK